MKTKPILRIFALFVSMAMVTSCGSDSNDDGGDPGNGGGPTSITISSNTSSVTIENNPAFLFTVTGNDNQVYNSTATVYVNDAEQANTTFVPTTIGTYSVYAKVGDVTSNTISVEAISGVDGIVLSTVPTVRRNSDISFTVTDNFNETVTDGSTFYVDGTAITGNVFTTDNTLGTKSVYAIYTNGNGDELQSPTLDFEVISYTQKVLVEDYTGTWCGFCPRLAYNLEQAEMQSSSVIGVGVHSGDVMETSYTSPLEAAYGVNGWPAGRINRNITWGESIGQLLGYTGLNATMGLAINSTLNGSSVSVDVKVGYDNGLSSGKLVVYLMEDGLLYDQRNYMNTDQSSPWFGAGDPIPDFEHNNVLREIFTDAFGDTIPDGQGEGEYTTTLTANIPGAVQDNNKLEIVAFIIGSNGTVINVQHAALGEDKDYD